jgi:hypothetical protein
MKNQQQQPQQSQEPPSGSATERKAPNFNNNNNAGKPAPVGSRDNRNPGLTESDRNGVAPEKPENLGRR